MRVTRITIPALALAALPALLAAQTDSGQRSPGRRTVTERGGAVNRSRGQGGNMGLTHDQMHQVQQSLADMGCYKGRVDGMMGPATRQAIACARRQHNLQGNNMNELFRAMNLNMTVEDSLGMDVMGPSGRRGGRSGSAESALPRMRDTSGGSAAADSGNARGNRRQGDANRGRGNAGTSGRRGGRDTSGTRPPRP